MHKNRKYDLVTFGEVMVVFSTTQIGGLDYLSEFVSDVGGAEANVAIGLQRLGHQALYYTQLGDDPLGTKVLKYIKAEGVDVSQIVRTSMHPTGIYFKEEKYPNIVDVYYYRQNSAAAHMTYEALEIERFFNTKMMHFTGITPFLSDISREMTLQCLHEAKRRGITVSFDPNIRFRLMENVEANREFLMELSSESDIVLASYDEARYMTQEVDIGNIMKKLMTEDEKIVIIKMGETGTWYKTKSEEKFVSSYPVSEVIDSTGAGDAFATGFLSSMLNGLSVNDAVTQGNLVAAINVMSRGDNVGLPTQDELNNFIRRNNRDSIKR